MEKEILQENLEYFKKQMDDLKPLIEKIQELLPDKLSELSALELVDAWTKLETAISDGVIIVSQLIETQAIQDQISTLIGKK